MKLLVIAGILLIWVTCVLATGSYSYQNSNQLNNQLNQLSGFDVQSLGGNSLGIDGKGHDKPDNGHLGQDGQNHHDKGHSSKLPLRPRPLLPRLPPGRIVRILVPSRRYPPMGYPKYAPAPYPFGPRKIIRIIAPPNFHPRMIPFMHHLHSASMPLPRFIAPPEPRYPAPAPAPVPAEEPYQLNGFDMDMFRESSPHMPSEIPEDFGEFNV